MWLGSSLLNAVYLTALEENNGGFYNSVRISTILKDMKIDDISNQKYRSFQDCLNGVALEDAKVNTGK